MGAYNATGDAISGRNETAAVGGDVVAMDTGDGNANGGNGTGGAANANGGTAISGDAQVVQRVRRPVLGSEDEGLGQRLLVVQDLRDEVPLAELAAHDRKG